MATSCQPARVRPGRVCQPARGGPRGPTRRRALGALLRGRGRRRRPAGGGGRAGRPARRRVVITTPDGRVLADAGDVPALGQAYAGACFQPSGTPAHRAGAGRSLGPPGRPGNHVVVRITAGRVDHGRIVAFSPAGEPDRGRRPDRRARRDRRRARRHQAARGARGGEQVPGGLPARTAHRPGGHRGRRRARGQPRAGTSTAPSWSSSPSSTPCEGDDEGGALVARPAGERFAAAWQRGGAARGTRRPPVVGFHREVVAVLGVPASGDVDRLVRELVREVSGDGGGGRRSFGTGVSRVAARPEEIPRAYEQARTAVRVGRRVQGAGGPGALRQARRLPAAEPRAGRRRAARVRGGDARAAGAPAAPPPDSRRRRPAAARSRCCSTRTSTWRRRPGSCTSTTTRCATGSRSSSGCSGLSGTTRSCGSPCTWPCTSSGCATPDPIRADQGKSWADHERCA